MGIVLIWSILFSEYWKRKESLFRLQFGQMGDDVLALQKTQPGFKGYYVRNCGTNELNFLTDNAGKSFMRAIVAYFVVFLMVVISVGTSIAIFFWKRSISSVEYHKLQAITYLNSLMIIIYEYVFKYIAVLLNKFQNHEGFNAYEDSLILKFYLFFFCNTFNNLIIISFIKPYLPEVFGQCVQAVSSKIQGIDCFFELRTQMSSTFILRIIFAFFPLLFLYVKRYFLLLSEKISIFKSKKWVMKQHAWYQIDRKIEGEDRKRDDYIIFPKVKQVSGILMDHVNIFTEITYLCLFSISFPLSYLFVFLIGIFQVHFDFHRFFNFYKRPLPQNAQSLGRWNAIMELTIYLTIFMNAGIFCFTLLGLEDTTDEITDYNALFLTFIIIIVISLVVKYLAQGLLSDIPSNFKTLSMRQNKLKNLVLESEFQGAQINVRAGVYLNLNSDVTEQFKEY